MSGYCSNVSAIVPTANGRGSTSSAAPCCFAASTAAPYVISPRGSVGPAPLASTRAPPRGAVLLRAEPGGPVRHPPVGERRAVLDREHTLAADLLHVAFDVERRRR